ncbi:hypothetical protein BN946_scf184970.g135 [Trametes cinnabarina]|uniref:Epoxide hydrolase N-terminal domain-containing protein n=1 Tax=Pycnoporus cinnabarinus TaxID=5643 RepID=A0A060SIP8_PYCCI|nr:hypothetical protein BN946_scf184970.g135 [Trametes cinnabarina]
MSTNAEKSFALSVPDSDVELLHKKLDLVRFPDELEGADWDYGAPLSEIQRLVEHWKSTFDWRKAEAEINKLPMFTRDIEVEGHGTLDIHYVHKKRPGHFLEVRKMLPLLTDKSVDHPSFHVVALSLPAFGFSEAPKKPGFSGRQYADYIKEAIGVTLKVKAELEYSTAWRQTGFGYFAVQSTKPQTLGYSLADSPVGLLAWIYEKLVSATDKYPWTDDEVIEWISIYWFSRAGPAAACRIYYEMTGGGKHDVFAGSKWTSVPLGVSYFPKEIVRVPRSWSCTLGKLVFESEHDKGGHFAAVEVPEKLASDLRLMYGKDGPAHGVVPGKTGYNQA